MHDYKIIIKFSKNQKNLLKRRLKFYIEYNEFSLPIVANDLNLIYLENGFLKTYVDKEFSRRPKPKILNSYEGEIPIEDRRIQKFCYGITSHTTGTKKYVGLKNAELNIVAALLCQKKYMFYDELNFNEGNSLVQAFTLAQYFNGQFDFSEYRPMEGDYIQYDIDMDRVKQNVIRISYSKNSYFFVVTSILLIFDNRSGLTNHENFKSKDFKSQPNSIDIKTGWITVTPSKVFMFFSKKRAASENCECALITDFTMHDDNTSFIKKQDMPAINTNQCKSRAIANITEFKSCSTENFEQAMILIGEYTDENIDDRQANFFQRSKRSAVPKRYEDQYDRDIKMPQSSLMLVVDNTDNYANKESVMNDELGEKFVDAVLDWKREIYLGCIEQDVDVNYQSKEHGMAAIHAAAQSGNFHAVEVLQKQENIDLLALSNDGDWLASDIAGFIHNQQLADLLMLGEIKQMKEKGIDPEKVFAESARRKKVKAKSFQNNHSINNDIPTNE